MLMEVKKSLKLMLYYIKFNIQSTMEYRFSFLSQVIGMMLNNSAFLFFWWVLFNKIGSIGGASFKDVMNLWSVSCTGFGIAFILFGNLRNVTKMIVEGQLDSYLLQPKNCLINILCSKTNLSAWGDFFFGIVIFILFNGFSLKFFMFLFFCITAALFMTAFIVSFHSLSFYVGSLQSLTDLVTEIVITFSIYPEGIFGGAIKFIFYSVIPVAFVTYMPVSILSSFNIYKLLLIIGVLILWLIIAYAAFYKGLKRYSSGNLIINKI